MASEHKILHGIGVCAGTASAPAAFVNAAAGVDPNETPSTDIEADSNRVRQAMADVAAGLRARIETVSDEKSKGVLKATAELAEDKGLAKKIIKKIKSGSGITQAVDEAAGEYAAMLEQLGGYMAERVTDLFDIRDRTICALRGLPAPGVPTLTEPVVLIANDLAPAETATLDPKLVAGIVTQAGGPTSHTAILAAQLGIPAVVKTAGVLDSLTEADTVALDGSLGDVIVSPTDEEVKTLADRAERRAAALAQSAGPGETKDGHKVKLLANIGTVGDAHNAAGFDLEGSGLFRSEFLFLDREQAPTLEEQTETYTEILKAFGNRRVVVRTLDAGADKPLAFANQEKEENPALGVRGLRLGMMLREDLLDTQLEALSLAYKQTQGDLWVMAPMIATVEDAQYFVDKARSYGLPKVGVMIEVPSAAICSEQILSVADFASLGTNDLSQYTMASDRTQGELAAYLNIWQPAVLRMIKAACDGGEATGKYVGVCGEAGGDPLMALVLTGLGVGSLSMAPTKVKAVRAALKLHDLDTCKKMADIAVNAHTAAEAREAVLAVADPILSDLI